MSAPTTDTRKDIMHPDRWTDGVPVAPLLRELGACSGAVQWVGYRDMPTAWRECQRADWMLWLCGKMDGKPGWPVRQQLTLAACACAEPALVHVRDGEDRPRLAIETARRWARGDATVTLDDVWTAANAAAYAAASAASAAHAADAAHAASAADAAHAASAAYAAYAASAAYAAFAADAAYAAYAADAASAAYAADAADAASAASATARKTALARMANLLRLPEAWR